MTNTVRHATIIDDAWVYTDWEPPRMRPGDAMAAGLGALLRRVAARTGGREGVVILDRLAALDVGIPAGGNWSEGIGVNVWAQLQAAGWKCGDLKPWTTLTADGLPTMHLGIAPWFGDFPIGVPPSGPNGWEQVGEGRYDWRATADALGLWSELTGSAYLWSPGVAALRVLQDMTRAGRLKPTWKTDNPIGPGAAEERWSPWIGPAWSNTHTGPMGPDWSAGHAGQVWVFDKRRAGLAAAASTEVCIGRLRHSGRSTFDRRLAGWWLIEVPAWNDPRLPHPCGPGVDPIRWVTTPTLALLDDLAQAGRMGIARVVDSWTGPGRRLFRYWAQRMEQAYQFASVLESPIGEAVADAVKRGAAREAHGMMASGRGSVQRDDWHHAITATKRANIFRVIDAQLFNNADAVPLMVDDDAITYDDPLYGLHVPVGTALGQFSMERMAL